MRLGVAVICVLLAAAAAAPYATDRSSVDQLINHLVSGKLTPKDIGNMMPWMTLRNLQNLKLSLVEKDLPSRRFPDAEDLPSVDQLIKQLRLGNLTRKDLDNMQPWMSPQYLLDLIIRFDDTDLQWMMTSMPDVKDLPSAEELKEQLISGELSPKEVASMMPRMSLHYLLQLKLSLDIDLLQQVMANVQDTGDLLPADDLEEQLISGNLSRRDVVDMMPLVSRQYLLDVVHSLPDELLPKVNKYVHSLPVSAPDVEDLPSDDELIEQPISGNLSQKDVMKMTPRMSQQHLLDVLHGLPDKLLQQIIEYVHSPPTEAANAEDLPLVDELIEQLISGNLSQKDVVNMTSSMSQQHLLDVPHSLLEKQLQQVNDFVQTDAPRRNDAATSEITEELDQHRLLLYLSLGGVLSLAAVLVVAALLMFVRRRRCSQQSAADQPPAMEKLSGAMAGEQLSSDGNDKRPRTTSSGSALASSLPSVDHHEYEPIRQYLLPPLPFNYHQYEPVSEELLLPPPVDYHQYEPVRADLLPPLPVNNHQYESVSEDLPLPPPVDYHQYEPIRKNLMLPLPEASPPSVPSQYDGFCASSQVYDHLLDR